jgi:hypothetical protein
MITRQQVADLGIAWFARTVRFALGWYWTPADKRTLAEAERLAREAYAKHAKTGEEI